MAATLAAVNGSAWGSIYEEVFPRVYRALIAMGARPDEAEDALHDAFARALQQPRIDHPDGWVFVTALRRWRRGRIRARLLRPLTFVGGGYEDNSTDERLTMIAALQRLTERQRKVVIARYVLGLTQEEVAALLGVTRGTVSATTSQAAAAMRRWLGP